MAQSETFYDDTPNVLEFRIERRRQKQVRADRPIPTPQLRIFRPVSLHDTTREQRDTIYEWQQSIDGMALENRGRGTPAARSLLHITYVSDMDMKRMLDEGRPGLGRPDKRSELLRFMGRFASDYTQMVRERGRNVIEQREMLLGARLDALSLPVNRDDDVTVDEVNLDDMPQWWGYARLHTKPNLEEFGKTKMGVIFSGDEVIIDEMQATDTLLRDYNLKPQLMESRSQGMRPHMTMYSTEFALGTVRIHPPEFLPEYADFGPPVAHINRND